MLLPNLVEFLVLRVRRNEILLDEIRQVDPEIMQRVIPRPTPIEKSRRIINQSIICVPLAVLLDEIGRVDDCGLEDVIVVSNV